MLSSWQLVNIPDQIAILLTTLALGLALAPWVGGIEVLGFRIPRLPRSLRKPVATIAIPCFLLALAGYYPLWAKPAGTATGCGFFRDDFGPNGEWQAFIPETGRAERFWVGCRVRASQSTTIRSVETALGVTQNFFAGLSDQKLVDRYQLSTGEEEWLAVPIELASYAAALRAFHNPSLVTFGSSADGGSIVGELVGLKGAGERKGAM